MRCIDTGQSGQRSIRCRNDIERQVEIIAIGFRVDQQGDPVAPSEPPVDIDQQPTVGDLRTARKIDALRILASYPRSQGELVDLQFFDGDVEAGQDRPVLFAWKKLGQRVATIFKEFITSFGDLDFQDRLILNCNHKIN